MSRFINFYLCPQFYISQEKEKLKTSKILYFIQNVIQEWFNLTWVILSQNQKKSFSSKVQ